MKQAIIVSARGAEGEKVLSSFRHGLAEDLNLHKRVRNWGISVCVKAMIALLMITEDVCIEVRGADVVIGDVYPP